MSIRISHPTDKVNFSRVDTREFTLWFSYETPIAVYVPGEGTFIRQNDWSSTTGKHLNEIDSDKSKRITGEQFRGVLARLGL